MKRAAIWTLTVLAFTCVVACFTVFVIRDSLPFFFIGVANFAIGCYWYTRLDTVSHG